MKKNILMVIVLSLASGAYAGSALEQLNAQSEMGGVKLSVPIVVNAEKGNSPRSFAANDMRMQRIVNAYITGLSCGWDRCNMGYAVNENGQTMKGSLVSSPAFAAELSAIFKSQIKTTLYVTGRDSLLGVNTSKVTAVFDAGYRKLHKTRIVYNAHFSQITCPDDNCSLKYEANGDGYTSPLIEVEVLKSTRLLGRISSAFMTSTPQIKTDLFVVGIDRLLAIVGPDGKVTDYFRY